MKKGDIFYSPKFKFFDGWVDDKFLIVLNNPTGDQPYLVVLTTAQQRNKYDKPGCYAADGYFFISQNTEWFNKATWVQFYDIHELDIRKVDIEKVNNNLIEKGKLKEDTLRAIINCIRISPSVSRYHRELLA